MLSQAIAALPERSQAALAAHLEALAEAVEG
jgi:hypothetical protein